MNELQVKTVDFNGSELQAVMDETSGKIYAGVKYICLGIGLTEGQIKAERLKIQSDLVLAQAGRNFVLNTSRGEREVFCIDLEYTPLWLAKISITPTMQTEQPEVTENLITYQIKVKDVLAAAFLQNSVSKQHLNKLPRTKPIDRVFRQQMNIAKSLAEHTGIRPEIAYATAITEAEKITGNTFEAYRALLPSASHSVGHLNPTQIGERLGKSARQANLILEEKGLQCRVDNEWRLTNNGFEFAEEFPYERNGHTGYQIRWHEGVLPFLSDTLDS